MFTDTMIETIKFNDRPQEWINDYLTKLKREKLGIHTAEARQTLLPYSPFVCNACGKLYVRDDAIKLQACCDSCAGGNIVPNAHYIGGMENTGQTTNKKEENYECMKCGQISPFSEIKSNKNLCVTCNNKHFVKTSLMEKVIENTWDLNQSLAMPLVDSWSERGKVYAAYEFDANDGPVSFVVCASGSFTEKDFLFFDFNNGDPQSKVYTLTNDVLQKFSHNDKTLTSWAFSCDGLSTAEYQDANGNLIQCGDSVEWHKTDGQSNHKGLVQGIVSELTPDGIIVALLKHPIYGHARNGKTLGEELITQQYILDQGVIAS